MALYKYILGQKKDPRFPGGLISLYNPQALINLDSLKRGLSALNVSHKSLTNTLKDQWFFGERFLMRLAIAS